MSAGSLPHYLFLLLQGKDLSKVRAREPGLYMNLEIGNDKDYLATRTSHLLNLTGPSMVIQTACSSALVSLASAVDAIRAGKCNIALAGGVSLFVPQAEHAHAEGMIWSHDGRCRPFDAAAGGTANCNGGGAFVLKDFEQAVADGDPMYGVISGVAVQNDGAKKDFTSPSIVGHASTIQEALRDAQPSEVVMVEAHATGTYVGDPIEIEALCDGYSGFGPQNRRNGLSRLGSISLGSVKGNIGHANTAAGAMGLAKVIMCVSRRVFVPSGNINVVNPLVKAKLESTASKGLFHIQTKVEPWPSVVVASPPRAVGISALGIGGTNAHLVVEECTSQPYPDEQDSSNSWILCFSASSELSVKKYAERLREHIQHETNGLTIPEQNILIRDISYTLFHHRNLHMGYRLAATANDLLVVKPVKTLSVSSLPTLVLLFPGQGVRLPNSVDDVPMHPEIVSILGSCPLSRFLQTQDPCDGQVALFAVQYSVAMQTIAALGLHEGQVIVCGHSLGEWAAAAVARAVSLPLALCCVKMRAELLLQHTSPGGGMASVAASLEQVMETIAQFPGVEVACINRIDRVTITGPRVPINDFVQRSGLVCSVLKVAGCAFHSELAEPAAKELGVFMQAQLARSHGDLNKPAIKWISSATADFVTDPPNPAFWVAQTRGKVRFSECVDKITQATRNSSMIFVDVGPHTVMRSLVKLTKAACICMMPKGNFDPKGLQLLWAVGVDTVKLNIAARGRRLLSIPHYVWDRVECWPDEQTSSSGPPPNETPVNVDTICYSEVWRDVEVLTNEISEFVIPFYWDGTAALNVRAWLPSSLSIRCHTLDSSTLKNCVAKFGMFVVFQGWCPENSGDINADQQTQQVAETLKIVQALVQTRLSLKRCIFVLPASRLFAGSIGVLRCASNEHPELNIKIWITESLQYNLDNLLAASSPTLDSAVELRLLAGNHVRVRRLISLSNLSSLKGSQAISADAEGTYIVTGGLGGLGRLVVNWLVTEVKARCVIIVSRRKAKEQDHDRKWGGCNICYVSCDIADHQDFARAINAEQYPKITGVFHCAGVVHDCLVQKAPIDPAELKVHMGAKVHGIETLMRGTHHDTFLVLFSSTSGALGSPGQVTYCAANTILDSSSAQDPRRKILSMQWGGWSNTIENSMSDRYGINPAQGERFLSGHLGLEAMKTAMRSGLSTVMVVDIYDWPRYCAGAKLLSSPLVELFPRSEGGVGWIPFETQLNGQRAEFKKQRWLLDHVSGGVPLLPATYLLEFLIDSGHTHLENVAFTKVAPLGRWYHQELSKCGSRMSLYSCAFAGHVDVTNPSQCHATASLQTPSQELPRLAKLLLRQYAGVHNSAWHPSSPAEMYTRMKRAGFAYGPAFALVSEIWLAPEVGLVVGSVRENDEEVSCRIATCVDACAHALGLLDPRAFGGFPVSVDRFWVSKLKQVELPVMPSGKSERKGWVFIARVSPRSVGDYDRSRLVFDVVAIRSDCSAFVLEGFTLASEVSGDYNLDLRFVEGRFEAFDLKQAAVNWDEVLDRECANAEECIVVDKPFQWLSLRKKHANLKVVCSSKEHRGFVGDTHQSAWFVAGRGALTFRSLDTLSLEGEEKSDNPFPARPFSVQMGSDMKPEFAPLTPDKLAQLSNVGRQQICVRVLVWGLNFLDVLAASGVMPPECFGGECIGVVLSVGPEVTHIAVGDRVAAVCLGGFASHLTMPACFAHVVPAHLTDSEAATIPVAYLTAWLALHWHARVSSKDTVLVHNASGGVGLACVNLLKVVGANINGTCGQTTQKIKTLREHGMSQARIFDSRDPATWVVGCGKVDVVVGALFGQSMEGSLQILKPMGRIVDIGKREGAEGGKLQLSYFLKGLTYSSAHLDALMTAADSSIITSLNQCVWESAGAGGSIVPLPFVEYGLEAIEKAMKFLSAGEHVGKVVVKMPPTPHMRLDSPVNSSYPQLHVSHDLKCGDALRAAMMHIGLTTSSMSISSICVSTLSISDPFIETRSSSSPPQVQSVQMATTCLMQHQNCCLVELDPQIAHQTSPDYALCERVIKAAMKVRHLVVVGSRDPNQVQGIQDEWRSLLLQSAFQQSAHESELDWLVGEVVARTLQNNSVTNAEIAKLTLEELGFDSLARLQLFHALRKQIPSTRLTELSGRISLENMCNSAQKDGTPSVRGEHAQKRWLVLHGFRTNKTIVAQQVAEFTRSCTYFVDCEFHFVEAPHPCRGEGPPGITDASHGKLLEWWGCEDEKDARSYDKGWVGCKGFDEATDFLAKACHVQSQGQNDFDGVIGFSQGGAMASWLVARNIIKRAVLFSPAGPAGPCLRQCMPTLGPATVVMLYDARDSAAVDFSDELKSLGLKKDQLKIWLHEAGHTIPHAGKQTQQTYQEVGDFLKVSS